MEGGRAAPSAPRQRRNVGGRFNTPSTVYSAPL